MNKQEHKQWAINAAEAITGDRYGIDDITFPTAYGNKTTRGVADLIQRKLPKVSRRVLKAFCSGFFLCEEIPDDWEEKEFTEQLEWLQKNVCEPYDRMSSEDVLDQIEAMENGVQSFLEMCGLEVEE